MTYLQHFDVTWCVVKGILKDYDDGNSFDKQLDNFHLKWVISVKQKMIAAMNVTDEHFFQILVNTLRPRQNGRYFDYTFKRIFVNENVRILIEISLKFVPKGPINNIPSLVQIMAWRLPGDKPLSGPMTVRLPTHICVQNNDIYMLQCCENGVHIFHFHFKIATTTSEHQLPLLTNINH